MNDDKGNYADVNGLDMYYEIHGSGEPLILLHGGLTTIDISFGKVLPSLAKSRQVIAVEQQAHGHTADIDRPLSFEQMADDTAALLGHLGIEEADVFGFSDGGNVAFGISIRHPDLVRKLVVAGTNFNNDGLYPEFLEFLKHAMPDDMGDYGTHTLGLPQNRTIGRRWSPKSRSRRWSSKAGGQRTFSRSRFR